MNKKNNRRNQKNRQRNRNNFQQPPSNAPAVSGSVEAAKESLPLSTPPNPSQPMNPKKEMANHQFKRPSRFQGNNPRHKMPLKKNHVSTPPGVKSAIPSYSKNQDDKSRNEQPSKYSEQRNYSQKNEKRGASNIGESSGERRVNTENLNLMELPSESKSQKLIQELKSSKKYGVIFYDTFTQAKNDVSNLEIKKNIFDQINIVIKEDGNMDDENLLKFGKVYSGSAWYLIHERRMQDEWYNTPHE